MSGNELTRRRVVLANDIDQLLGLGRLHERGKPTQVEVDDGDLGTMPREELCALVARDQRGDLWRDKSRELGLLALDSLEQLRVADRDRALVRESRHELDLPGFERPGLAPREPDDAEELVVEKDREPEQAPVPADLDAGI